MRRPIARKLCATGEFLRVESTDCDLPIRFSVTVLAQTDRSWDDKRTAYEKFRGRMNAGNPSVQGEVRRYETLHLRVAQWFNDRRKNSRPKRILVSSSST